jgi:hypothetical protein
VFFRARNFFVRSISNCSWRFFSKCHCEVNFSQNKTWNHCGDILKCQDFFNIYKFQILFRTQTNFSWLIAHESRWIRLFRWFNFHTNCFTVTFTTTLTALIFSSFVCIRLCIYIYLHYIFNVHYTYSSNYKSLIGYIFFQFL